MATLRYNVACSLDGFIAPPDESTDWIVHDPSIDFAKLYAEFDAYVMGRKTYEAVTAPGYPNPLQGKSKDAVVVVSRTMKPEDHPSITIIGEGHVEHIRQLKQRMHRDIWLMGGSQLAADCLDAGLLDSVETAIMPVVLRSGYRLIAETSGGPSGFYQLHQRSLENLQKSGILMVRYDVVYKEA